MYQATTITITVPTDIKTTRAVLKAFYVILTITGMMNCNAKKWTGMLKLSLFLQHLYTARESNWQNFFNNSNSRLNVITREVSTYAFTPVSTCCTVTGKTSLHDVSKMTWFVLSGTWNLAHSLTHRYMHEMCKTIYYQSDDTICSRRQKTNKFSLKIPSGLYLSRRHCGAL